PEVYHPFPDLPPQLPRRHHDQRLRVADIVVELQLFEDRNRKRRGLACAGAGLADDVDFLQRKRDQPRLNRRRVLISGLFEGVKHDVRQAEAFKRDSGGGAIRQIGIPAMVSRISDLRHECFLKTYTAAGFTSTCVHEPPTPVRNAILTTSAAAGYPKRTSQPRKPPNMTPPLSGELHSLVQQELATGHYSSADEVLLTAVRLLRERNGKLESLRREIEPALARLDRGEGIPLDME